MRFVNIPLRADRLRLDEWGVAIEDGYRMCFAERILRLERSVRGAKPLDLNGILHVIAQEIMDSRMVLRRDDDGNSFVAPTPRRIDNMPNQLLSTNLVESLGEPGLHP